MNFEAKHGQAERSLAKPRSAEQSTALYDNPAFLRWYLYHHCLTPEVAAIIPAQFVRQDGWFDTVAWDRWVEARYKEFLKEKN